MKDYVSDTRSAPDRGSDLTAAEQLIWTGQRLDPESPLYNMALAVDIGGPVDLEALDRAYRLLVDSDEVLRTVFVERAGSPFREVLETVDTGVEIQELPESAYTDDDVARVLRERTRRPFALDAPLVDVGVVRRAADRVILFINQHHITTDAWSTGVLFRRLSDLYQRVEEGGDHRSPEPPPFRAYIAQERSERQSDRMARNLEYWEATKSSFQADPAFYGKAGAGSGRTRRARVRLGDHRLAGLQRLAARAPFRALSDHQSRYQVFATAMLAWLSRVTGDRHVSVGVPWHNRRSADLKDTLGLFVELYPLRVPIEEGETLLSLGSKVAETTLEMMHHVTPGASASPATRGFPAVLNYITADLGNFGSLPTRVDWIHSGYGDPAHKVRLQVHDFEGDGRLTLDFDLDVEVFDPPAREWAVRHFLRLFDALCETPEREIASVPLVTWEEEHASAPVGRSHETPTSVLSAIRARAEEDPGAVAIVDQGREVTREALTAASRGVANALQRAGVGRGDRVGICSPRSAALIAGVLGIHECGAAFVPLDPGHPDERSRLVLEDAGVDLVLAAPELSARVLRWGGRPLPLDVEGWDHDRSLGIGSALPAASDLAYVLYTSGSTGRPKGVEITHGALADYAVWAARTYCGGEPLRFPFFTSPAFDFTLTSIFAPLLAGGTIVVYRGEAGDGGLLVRRVFEEDRVDVVKVTPSHLALLRDLDLAGSRVRRLVVGGEDLSRSVATRIHRAFAGDVEILNEYGPTEATVGCMLHRYDPAGRGASVPIGQPAGNTRIHVVDAHGNPTLRGIAGEICIRGPRLARGYRNRPAETHRAFVPVPGRPGESMYRTGDRGRWSAGGPLEFLGRTDDQVKVRGVRVELGEVEAILSGHPAIDQVAAKVVRGRGQGTDHCLRCGLEAAHPEAQLDEDGVCSICRRFDRERELVESYFGDLEELEEILDRARHEARGPHDTLMLYSGGKDSTYALCRIVEMGANPLVFMLDNGFISDQAKANVRRVVDQLGLELVVGETPAMPRIFADSLQRFSNVCNGCFKTIYTLALTLAVERGIPAIVTGLSRGQIFETRLSDLYRRGIHDPAAVDRMILDARKAYHRMDDAVSRTLDTSIFETDEVLDRIRFIDFYRYSDVELADLLAYVGERTPWIRPADTGRSTNCLINEAGIFVHRTERGFHNYSLPYSWDVRLGHKSRDAVLAELDDDLDPGAIRRMLDDVGYREHAPPGPEARLVAYYTADDRVPVSELRDLLSRHLPDEAIPAAFSRLEQMPLTSNGKVDRDALPEPQDERPVLEAVFVPPRSPNEVTLAGIWSDVLGLRSIGVHDDFFELGGDSMHTIQIVSAARHSGLVFAPRDLFANPTVAALARIASAAPAPDAPAAASVSDSELAELEKEIEF